MNMKLRNIPFSPPDMTEAEANEVREAILSGWITTGPKIKEFERLISICCQTPKAVALNSATAAMELTLRVLGVGPGDEVIVPAYTYTATASVVHHVGAKIVMVDVAYNSFEIDYDRIADAITEKTKVIMPVDLGGMSATMTASSQLWRASVNYSVLRMTFRRHLAVLLYWLMRLMLLVQGGMTRCVEKLLTSLRSPSMR